MKNILLKFVFTMTLTVTLHAVAHATAVNCNTILTSSYKLDTTYSAYQMATLMGVHLNAEDKIWVHNTQALLNRLSQFENYSKEQGDLNVGDLPLIQNELTQYLTRLEVLKDRFAFEASSENVVPNTARDIHMKEVIEINNSVILRLQKSLETKTISYREFFGISYYVAYAPRRITIPLEEFFEKLESFPNHHGKYILLVPTSKELTMDLMNIFSGQKIGFGGILLEDETYADDTLYESDRFLEHDINHLTFMIPHDETKSRLRSALADIDLIRAIFANAPPSEMRMRRVIWFHFWHEYSSDNGPLPDLSRKMLFGQYLRKPLQAGGITAVAGIRERIYKPHDMGADPADFADYRMNFETTLTSLKNEFPAE